MAKKPQSFGIPENWPVQDQSAYWRLDRFIPYANNTRTHPPAEIAMLAGLLGQYGPDQPIVVDEDRVIIKGHGRRLAALAAGLEIFTFVQRFGLSEEEKKAMRIADNQVALLAGWDQALVRVEIASLKGAGYDVALLGFGDAQLVQFMTTPGPPSEFQAFGADIAVEHQCPKCGYKWSGNSAPKVEEPAKTKKAK